MKLLLYCLLGIAIVTPSVLLILWAKYFPEAFRAFWKDVWKKTTRIREIISEGWRSLWKRTTGFFRGLRKTPHKGKLLLKFLPWVLLTVVGIFVLYKFKLWPVIKLPSNAGDTATIVVFIVVGCMIILGAWAIPIRRKLKAKREAEADARAGRVRPAAAVQPPTPSKKNWYTNPITYIIIAVAIPAVLLGRKWILSLSGLEIGLYAGAVVLGLLIWLGIKNAGWVGASASKLEAGKSLKGFGWAIVVLFGAVLGLQLLQTKVGGNLWADTSLPVKVWAIAGLAIGAFICTKKGWVTKIGGVVLMYMGAQMAWGEVYAKYEAGQMATAQARAQVLAQKAANTPASEKFWTIKVQRYTQDGILLDTYNRYNALVKQLDTDGVEMTVHYTEHGKPRQCHFVWNKRETPEGTWQQHDPPAQGTFRLWPDEGGRIDHWVGQEVTASGLRLRLELEGKMTP